MEKYSTDNTTLKTSLLQEESELMQKMQQIFSDKTGEKIASERQVIEDRLNYVRSKIYELDKHK